MDTPENVESTDTVEKVAPKVSDLVEMAKFLESQNKRFLAPVTQNEILQYYLTFVVVKAISDLQVEIAELTDVIKDAKKVTKSKGEKNG